MRAMFSPHLHTRLALTALAAAAVTACGGNDSPQSAAEPEVASRALAATASTVQTATVATVWTWIASEGMTGKVSSPTQVRFGGNGGKWITKTLNGTFVCNIRTFGVDPFPGVAKQCQVAASPAPSPAPAPAPAPAPTPTPTPTPAPAPAGTWQKIASYGGTYTLTGIQKTRYGSGSNWMYRQDSGTGTCNSDYLQYWGPNPVTECQVFVPAAASAPAVVVGGGPMIDVSKIPQGESGYAVDRIQTSAMTLGASDGTGAFRVSCAYSHMLFDDPIVKPGQPGMSHLHMFFGNTGVTANSTVASIATSGSSTCAGGTVNRSSYWAPAMIDTRDGTPLQPSGANFYYKTGYNGISPSTVQAPPEGLRMVAGDSTNKTAPAWLSVWYYQCASGQPSGNTAGIRNCAVGDSMVMAVTFPQCWDGVNLDSPDHKSHMAYPVSGKCPTTHPVAIPEISYHFWYLVKEVDAPLRWRLSSDNYDTSLPGGYSAHADYVFGWKTDVLGVWLKNCDQAAKDCHNSLLGDGRTLF